MKMLNLTRQHKILVIDIGLLFFIGPFTHIRFLIIYNTISSLILLIVNHYSVYHSIICRSLWLMPNTQFSF